MPSQEDYLDNLLKNLGMTEETENEAESDVPESDMSDVGIPEDTEPDIASENVEDLLEDAVADLEAAIGSGSDLDLNELLEQKTDPGLGLDEMTEHLDIDTSAALEELLPEDGLTEPDAFLEDAVADLETVLEAGDGMVYSDMAEAAGTEVEEPLDTLSDESVPEAADSDLEQAVAALTETTDSDGEEPDAAISEDTDTDLESVDAALEEIIEGAEEDIAEPDFIAGDMPESDEDFLAAMEEAIHSVQEEEDKTEQELGELLDTMEVPESVEISDTMEVPESVEIPDTMEVPESVEISDAIEVPESAPDLDAVSTMSEDEIEQFLSASADEDQMQTSADEETAEELPDEDMDLMELLGDTDDSDLLDIQDMLDKADNNEAVGEEIEALLQGATTDEPAEAGITEIEDEKSKRAQDKKRKRQEKAAAKKAAKEAKAAAKAAGKAADKEEKAASTAPEQAENTTADSNDFFDSDLLDSIVSGADQAGLEETEQPKSDDADILGDQDLLGEISGDNGGTAEEDATGGSDDALEFDMDSLFGDGIDSDLGSDTEALLDDDAAFPDFIGLKKEDADLTLPEMEDEGKKKKGLLARFFDMLTEEDEDEESESLQLSDENKEILSDLDKEKTAGKKKKKKKAASGQGDEEEEGGKGKAKAKKPKKPKPEKPKKEKEPEPEPLIPEKKLTPKKVIPVLLVCASLGVLIVVFANASVDFTAKKEAHDAYYEGDYQTCYENLFGKELNETEQIMFGTSESILRMRLWLREYELFVEADEEVEALDSLIQTVKDFPELYAYAVQFNAGDEVMAAYANILNILYEKYRLTEAQAQEIAAVRSNYTYTKMVVDIVLGKPFGSWNEPEYTEPESTPLPDELPEEEELSGGSFINNQ